VCTGLAAYLGGALLVALVCVGACNKSKQPKPPANVEATAVDESDQLADPGAAIIAAAPTLPSWPDSPDQAAPSTDPVVRIHLESEPSSLNPLVDGSFAAEFVTKGLIYESLADCRDSSEEGPRPWLARSWKPTADGLAFDVELRDDTTWHDGRPFLPIDVQASFEVLLRNVSRAHPLHAFLSDLESVEIRLGQGVRFRLRRPRNTAPHFFCSVPILPGHLIRAEEASWAGLSRKPVGTGPFVLSSWDRGRSIRLEGSHVARGRPARAQALEFVVIGDGAKALTQVKRGQIDILPRVLPLHFPGQLKRVAIGSNLQTFQTHPQVQALLSLRTGHPLLAVRQARQALSHLWDRKRVAKALRKGLVEPSVHTPFDREKARALLDEAGFLDENADGVRDLSGEAIRLRYLVVKGADLAAKEAHQFALELRRVGLLLDIVPLEPEELLRRLGKGDFEIAPMQWRGRLEQSPEVLLGQGAPYNFGRYESSEIEAALDQILLASNASDRIRQTKLFRQMLVEHVPVILLHSPIEMALASTRIGGLAFDGQQIDLRGVWVR